MPTDKHQLSVALEEDDYRWLQQEAVRAGISKSGVLRQALSLYQATGGLLGPMRMRMTGHVYAESSEQADETEHSAEENEDTEDDEESTAGGLDSFKTTE